MTRSPDTDDSERLGQEYREAVYAAIQAALVVAQSRKDFEVIVAQCESIAGYRDVDEIWSEAARQVEALAGKPDLDEVLAKRKVARAKGRKAITICLSIVAACAVTIQLAIMAERKEQRRQYQSVLASNRALLEQYGGHEFEMAAQSYAEGNVSAACHMLKVAIRLAEPRKELAEKKQWLVEEAERKRLAKEAEQKRLAEEKERKRLADEAVARKRAAEEAERKRATEVAEQRLLAEEAEQKRAAAQNEKRQAFEREHRRAAAARALTGFAHKPGALVAALAIHPSGTQLVTGDRSGGAIKFWSLPTGDLSAEWRTSAAIEIKDTRDLLGKYRVRREGIEALAYSPDGQWMAVAEAGSCVIVRHVASGDVRATLCGHDGRVNALGITPDGKHAVSGSNGGGWGKKANLLKLWSFPEGNLVATLQGHSNDVRTVAMSPDGTSFASGSDDASILIWSLPAGALLRTLNGHVKAVHGLSISHDGRYLASGGEDATVRVWSYPSGQLLATFVGHGHPVKEVAFAHDGNCLASSADRVVKLWSIPDGALLETWVCDDRVESLAFTPAGVFVGDANGRVMFRARGKARPQYALVDAALLPLTNEAPPRATSRLAHGSRIHALAFNREGSLLASAGRGVDLDDTLKIWEWPTGRLKRALRGHADWVTSVAFSPDGQYLASGADDHTIKIWPMQGALQPQTLTGHREAVACLAYSPDGKLLVSGSWDKTVKLWAMPEGRERATLSGHDGKVNAVAINPTGQLLATAGEGDNAIRLWELPRGKLKTTLSKGPGPVNQLAMSPDGRWLASGSGYPEGSVTLWTLPEGRLHRTVKAHTNWVGGIAFSLEGNLLISGGRDSSLKLWSIPDLSDRGELRSPGLIGATCVSSDGASLVAGAGGWGAGGILGAWPLLGEGSYRTLEDPRLRPLRDIVPAVGPDVHSTAASTGPSDGTIQSNGPASAWVPPAEAKTTDRIDMASLRRIVPPRFGGVESVTFAAAREWLLITQGTHSGNETTTWSIRTGEQVSALEQLDPKRFREIEVSPHGSFASWKSYPTQGSAKVNVYRLSNLALIQTFSDTDFASGACRWMPDEQTIVLQNYRGNPTPDMGLWSVSTGRKLSQFKASAPLHGVSQDGKYIVCIDDDPNKRRPDGSLYRIELIPVASVSNSVCIQAHSSWIAAVDFSPVADLMASASADDTVKLWSLPDGGLIHTLEGHAHIVKGVRFSPDGRTLVSVSLDGTVRFWDVKTGVQLGCLTVGNVRLTCVEFSPDGKTCAIGDHQGSATLYAYERLKELACMPPAKATAGGM